MLLEDLFARSDLSDVPAASARTAPALEVIGTIKSMFH
jgi:hypothetical protein